MKNYIKQAFKSARAPYLVAGAALLVLAVVWYTLSVEDDVTDSVSEVQVTSGPMVITVTGPGRIRARDAVDVEVPSSVDGDLQLIYLISEGKMVQRGDIIARLDTTNAMAALEGDLEALETAQESYDSTVEQQTNQMQTLENQIRSAELAHRQAELQLNNLEFSSDLEKQQGALNVAKAEISLNEAKRKVAAQMIINEAQLEQVRIQLEGRRLDVEEARAALRALTIRAPISGLVIHGETGSFNERRKIVEGDQLRRGQDIIQLPDLSVLQVVITINELDAERVRIGQPARVRLEAYPRAMFDAHVSEISTLAQETSDQGNVRVFPAVVTLDAEDERVRPGMSASAEILVGQLDEAVQVPLSAVAMVDGRPYVMKVNASGPTPVELGARNESTAEVVAGVSLGDRVLLDWARDPRAVLKNLAGELHVPEPLSRAILSGTPVPLAATMEQPPAGAGERAGRRELDPSRITPEMRERFEAMRQQAGEGGGRGAGRRGAMSDSARTVQLMRRYADRMQGLPEDLRTELEGFLKAGGTDFQGISQALRDSLDAWRASARPRRPGSGTPPPDGDPADRGVDDQ